MESKRRTQSERTAATRGALVAAGRRLWAERGYADVGTPEIAAAAGVTRGAMYHQFADKSALFLAVAEAVEGDVTARLGEHVAASGAQDPAAALHAAVDGWLEACEEPEVRQVLLLDGPVVLGWDGFRDMALRYGLGLTEAMLRAAIDAGRLAEQPTRALAHVLLGALDEAALYVATSEDREAARDEVAQLLHALLDGMFRGQV
ncbi:MAG TPA: TetR/AcrR family transcriptional regulator [Solirubrobacteraceae bacterium]|nr:TetR/AcrR family transcriptional regulator [Solirubrobacteraceae bacterium]